MNRRALAKAILDTTAILGGIVAVLLLLFWALTSRHYSVGYAMAMLAATAGPAWLMAAGFYRQYCRREAVRSPGPAPTPAATLYCSFCGQSEHDVLQLIAGPKVFVCDRCVDLCGEIIAETRASKADIDRSEIERLEQILGCKYFPLVVA